MTYPNQRWVQNEVISSNNGFLPTGTNCPCSVGVYRFKFDTDEKP